jgi:hypothetical protein
MDDNTITVKTISPERRILVDIGFEDTVWFHMSVAGGTAYAGLTIEQAKYLVAGINSIIRELES